MAAPADKTTKNLSGKWVLVRCDHEHSLALWLLRLLALAFPLPSPRALTSS